MADAKIAAAEPADLGAAPAHTLGAAGGRVLHAGAEFV